MKQVFSLVALLVSLCLIRPAVAGLFQNAIYLDDNNFNAQVTNVDKDTIWLITFYVPWCDHCKSFAPVFDQTVNRLRADGYKINYGAIDVDANPKTGRFYNINSSPTVKVFYHNGEDIEERNYLGERDSDSLYNYCQNFYRSKNLRYSRLPADYVDGTVIDLNDDSFDDTIYSSNDIWIVKFGAPWCHHCKLMVPAEQAVAQTLGDKVRFASVDADANRGLARRFGITKLPSIKYFKAGYGKKDDSALDYTGGRSEFDLKTFGTKLWNQYIENPELFAYVPEESCMTLDDEPCDPSTHTEFDCGIEYCDDPTHNHHHHGHVPEQINGLCPEETLCVVAFLDIDQNHEQRVADLKTMATNYAGTNVSFFWLEANSYSDCEGALAISFLKNPVIAFSGSDSTFVTMHSDFNLYGLEEFIHQIEREGLSYGRQIPDGQIELLTY